MARGGSGENPDGFPQNFFNFTWNNPSFRPATLFVILTPPRRRPLSCTINNIGQSLFSRAGDFFPEKAAEKKGKTNDLRRCDISLRSLLSVSSIFLVTPDRLLRRHTLPYLLATSEVTVSFSGVSIVRPIYYVHNLHFPLARFPTRSPDKKNRNGKKRENSSRKWLLPISDGEEIITKAFFFLPPSRSALLHNPIRVRGGRKVPFLLPLLYAIPFCRCRKSQHHNAAQ